ncbi:S1/P1 nuclease [Pseudoflavitalea rhizosphaerae]|uniref:S1/P1 nuclease n=1 Tax=Pseudoflavitalea rhizosphaerae TaxID=1884793 RepID=UPI000F8E42E7|nr:S1/P1 nuclease [Pseudoflavitalea rhizosphaerae]
MKTMRKLLLAAILFYFPLHSMAWGVLGHRIVAEIANSYLTNKARKQIQRILGNESMAMTSNWPDFIKSDTSFNYLSPWHYINLREGLTEAAIELRLKQDTTVNAYTKIGWLTEQLKDRELPVDKKLMYLRLLIHLVGDVHQPMHVGRFEDLGGNRIRVQWFNSPTNLHVIWDEKLIDFQQLSYTEYVKAINHTTKEQRKAWQAESTSRWIIDSYNIAQQLYAEITSSDQKLSYRYNFDHVKTLNDQLLKGGVHLAGLLNQIFG